MVKSIEPLRPLLDGSFRDIVRSFLCKNVARETQKVESSLLAATTLSSMEEHFVVYLQKLEKIFKVFIDIKKKIESTAPQSSAKTAKRKPESWDADEEKRTNSEPPAVTTMLTKMVSMLEHGIRRISEHGEQVDILLQAAFTVAQVATDELTRANELKSKEEQISITEAAPGGHGHMSQAATKVLIGVEGGQIELHGFRVNFPSHAVDRDREFTLSVDNNYMNYPTQKGVPIAPIFGVSPPVKFNRPVTVNARTWYSAASGKQQIAQLLTKEGDGDWREEDLEIIVPDKNEVCFSVRHFCSKIIMVSKESSVDGLYYFINEVYMQKKTGSIMSAFYRDPKTQGEAALDFSKLNYHKVHPNYIILSGPLDSVFKVKFQTIKPKEIAFIGGKQDSFKLVQGPNCGLVQICWYPETEISGKYDGGTLRINYSVYHSKPGDAQHEQQVVDEVLHVAWPIESPRREGQPDVLVNVNQSKNALDMVNGGKLIKNQNDTAATLVVKD